jgi:NAD(P)-dependent dehydrogenase (short-subunit alcohol dehydrogenase family)
MNIAIIGASRGIGRATALEFAKLGNNTFYLTYNNSNSKNMWNFKEELEQMGNKAIIFKVDVTNINDIKSMAFTIRDFLIKIDYLINCVGIVKDRTLAKMSDDEFNDTIDTNLNGVMYLTKKLLPFINDYGSIINMSSVIGHTGNFGQCVYGASKAGLEGFTKSLAIELSKRRIRVNCLVPSLVDTDIFNNVSPEQKQKLVDRTLLKRMATPEEIAKLIRFICIDGTYFNGDIIPITGGFQ